MTDTNIIILYVRDIAASGRFYADLLQQDFVDSDATFMVFPLSSGLALGLWQRSDVRPAPTAEPGGSEIGFKVGDAATVETMHAAWKARGVAIATEPTKLEFGHTFVAVDPDGHRLRVYSRAERD